MENSFNFLYVVMKKNQYCVVVIQSATVGLLN